MLTCQGLPFFQAGEEFARTKHGDPNTYRGPAEENRLDWARAASCADLVDFYRGLFAIRRGWDELSALGETSQPRPLLLALPDWMIGFVPERPGKDEPGRLAVYYNPEPRPQTVSLPAGRWRTLCNGEKAAALPFGPVWEGAFTLPAVSAVILCAVEE